MSARVLALGGVLLALGAVPAGAEPKTCDESGQCCDEWVVDLHSPDGKKWGTLGAPTFQRIWERLERAEEHDRNHCRWMGLPYPCDLFTHDHPGAPRCLGTRAEAAICRKDELLRRLDGLDADLTRRKGDAVAAEALRATVSKGITASGIQDPLSGNGASFLADFGESVDRASIRARVLRETVTSLGDSVCLPGSSRPGANGLWGIGASFGDHEDARTRAERLTRELLDLEEQARDRIRPLPHSTVTLTGMLNAAKGAKRSGGGRLVFGDRGTIDIAPALPAGTYPVVFLWQGSAGLWSFGRVAVTALPTDGGERFLIQGGAGPNQENIEVRVGPKDRDGDGVADPDDACPDIAGPEKGCPPSLAPEDTPRPTRVDPGAPVAFTDSSNRQNRGYKDASGNVVIPSQFLVALPFCEGLAAVIPESPKGAGFGFIDLTGKLVIPPRYKNCTVQKLAPAAYAGEMCCFRDGQAFVCEDTVNENCHPIDRDGNTPALPELAPAPPPPAAVTPAASPVPSPTARAAETPVPTPPVKPGAS